MPNLLAAVAGALLALAQARSPVDTTTIHLVATTDVHGRAMAWDYERDREAPLGLVRVATVVDSLRRLYPGRVVLVDVGDLLQGNPFATYYGRVAPAPAHPIIDLMNRMGYDAATPGNHDFNFGLETLSRAVTGARFPYVSANIVGARTGRPTFAPAAFVTRGGVRVGITGVTTPGVLVWDGPAVRGVLDVRGIAEAVPPAMRRMRRDGADVTVLLAHAGLDGPSSYGARPDAAPEHDVAAALAAAPETDVAFIGHTHREIADSTVHGVLVVQPRYHARSVAVAHVTLERSGGRWRVMRKWSEIVPLASVRPDSALVTALLPAHQAARAWATAPLGRSTSAMPARTARREDTPVVDFINAVQRARSGADLSATAAFDTSGGLPAGDVRIADIASIYPYDNTLKAVRISGADLRAYLEASARYYRGVGPGGPIVDESIPGYNFDIVSPAEYALDLSRPVGSRVTRLRAAGRDVLESDSFTLAVNNYRQAGGGGFAMIARAPVVYDRAEDVRELLADEIRRRGTIRPDDYFVRDWELLGGPQSRDSVVLRILATNDLHGALLPRVYPWSNGEPVGGAEAIAGMMDRLARQCGCPTLRLDAGDAMQGSAVSNLSYGRATVEVLNAMGYAAVAVGNHEFDWSVDTLAARVRDSHFTWVSANVRGAATGTAPPWVAPWRMVGAGPLKVAVLGYTTASTPTSTNPRNVSALAFAGGGAVLDSTIVVARREGADVVIVLAHAGAFCDERRGCDGEVIDLARSLRQRPDLILSGHTHSALNTAVAGIPVVQARSNGTTLGVVDFVAQGNARTVRARLETVWSDRERRDTAVARIVDGYLAEVEPLTARRIADLARPLERSEGQYALGNVIADAYRAAAGADVGLVNNGGIRAGLDAGPVLWGELFEVVPFQNFIVRLDVSGAVLRAALEHAVASSEPRAHVSGLRVRVDPARPPGRRVVEMVLADGRRVRDTDHYTLAVPDFLAAGGSGYAMLRGRPLRPTGVADLDALVTYLEHLPQPINPSDEVRLLGGRGP